MFTPPISYKLNKKNNTSEINSELTLESEHRLVFKNKHLKGGNKNKHASREVIMLRVPTFVFPKLKIKF